MGPARAGRRILRALPIGIPGWVLLLLGAVAVEVSGQVPGPSLRIRVQAEDAPVPGAEVELRFLDRVLHTGRTDADGVWAISGLPAGTFTLRIRATGFPEWVEDGVRIDAGARIERVIRLRSPTFELEGITVLSDRVRADPRTTEFSTRVDERAIQLLPLARDAAEIVSLTPGARPGQVWGGASVQANSYRLDGLSVNHPGLGGDLLQPSLLWIDRIEVRGLGAGAEHGGFQGGLIDVATKKGGDRFEGRIQSNFEDQALNGTNLVSTEIGREISRRSEVEGEVRGPILPGRLHYYLSGSWARRDRHALNHLPGVEGRLAPLLEEREDGKAFGRVDWTPDASTEVVLSGAYTHTHSENHELTGYEAPGATHRLTAPTRLLNASAVRRFGGWGSLELRANELTNDTRRDAALGTGVPGIRLFALTPPYTAFGNAPFTLRSAPSTRSLTLEGSLRRRLLGGEQLLRFGIEESRSTFLDRRTRNGGITWLPARSSSFDPGAPATWSRFSWVASQWGGEVHLDADVASRAAFIQGTFALGPRIVLTPGVRASRWRGFLTPREGERFQAVEDFAPDPRIGLSVVLTRDGTLLAKGHWGRYHQDLITQMFDRAAGADVFSNEELWYYWGPRFADPATRFTAADRDALAAQGLFRRESVVALNETGPVEGYRQPHVDQWLVGFEKQFRFGAKFEMLYTRRTNGDMIALVDRNRERNYTRFQGVRVFDSQGGLLPMGGGSVYLPEVWLPNFVLVERLRCKALADCPDMPGVPGLTAADTLSLSWNPDYVLTTAPGARREFEQWQLTLEVARVRWGGSASFVWTDLRGNLDNVAGYDDPSRFSSGPWVRVNEGVNSWGRLENFAEQEAKVSIWGQVTSQMRAGVFWNWRSGDPYAPRYRVTSLGVHTFRVNAGATTVGRGGGLTVSNPGQLLDYRLFWPLEGHDFFVGPRGRPELKGRAKLDLRIEHRIPAGPREAAVSIEVFNLFGDRAITELQTMVNNGPDYWSDLRRSTAGTAASQYYRAPQERVAPRSIRLGLALLL